MLACSGGRRSVTAAPAGPGSDWAALWRELVGRAAATDPERSAGDYWAGRAEAFDARMQRYSGGRDALVDLVVSKIEPEDTVLDIGAGTGAWTIPLARRAARVTALDSSPAMLEVLRSKLTAGSVSNVDVRAGSWPEAEAGTHDHILAIHSVYGTSDLPRFVDAMTSSARRTCYLGITFPIPTSITRRAAVEIWGSQWGRADFVVAYNVLLEMGLMPDVWIDDGGDAPEPTLSLAEALAKVKRLLGLGGADNHDAHLRELLTQTLEPAGDGYRWPPQARSALVYWRGESG